MFTTTARPGAWPAWGAPADDRGPNRGRHACTGAFRLKTLLARGARALLLAALNRAFHGRFTAEDFRFLRTLTDAGIHGDAQLARSVQILATRKLVLDASNQDAVALAAAENLPIGRGEADFLKRAAGEGLSLDGNIAGLLGAIERHRAAAPVSAGGAPAPAAASTLRQIEQIAALNQLDALGDLAEGFQIAYSQEGEAAILDRLFDYRSTGFYVDVGACHPKRFSNTYACYRRGWRGVNIEPTPGAQALFERWRPRDIFQPCAIARQAGQRRFFLFEEPALNTFDEALAEEYGRSGYRLSGTRDVEVRPLASVLAGCGIDVPIDFMSVDVEESEMEVLDSNDWERFRPRILLMEILGFDLQAPGSHPVHDRVQALGYRMIAKTFNTVIYRDARG